MRIDDRGNQRILRSAGRLCGDGFQPADGNDRFPKNFRPRFDGSQADAQTGKRTRSRIHSENIKIAGFELQFAKEKIQVTEKAAGISLF